MAYKDRIINKNKIIVNDNSRSTAYYRGRRKYKTIKHSNYSTINSQTYGTSDNLIVRNSHTTYDSVVETNHDRNRSIFGGLFKISLVLVLGSFFFNGFIPKEIENTIVETSTYNSIITNETYNYNIKYADYDYTEKLKQLSGLRNVFTLEPLNVENLSVSNLRVPNPFFFMEGEKYHDDSYIVGQMINDKIITLVEETFTYSGNTYSYYYMHLDSLIVPLKYQYTYENYVNSNNVLSWVDYQKKLIDNPNYNYSDEWYYYLEYGSRVLFAPIVWLSNFSYDLGIIMRFILYW